MSLPTSKNTFHAKRSGVATVEFAMTAGLAFFFFFAALEFCRVSMMRHTVENALYEAARTGIVPGATNEEVEASARSMLGVLGIRTATINVTPSPILIDSPEIEVRIQMRLDQNLFAPPFFFRGATIDRTFSMRREIPN